ncbi:hypothetical protein M8J76_012500 [Diaphorina citri]|nr:hypothetical protein M8J76_012500 [Diaphorina citri]
MHVIVCVRELVLASVPVLLEYLLPLLLTILAALIIFAYFSRLFKGDSLRSATDQEAEEFATPMENETPNPPSEPEAQKENTGAKFMIGGSDDTNFNGIQDEDEIGEGGDAFPSGNGPLTGLNSNSNSTANMFGLAERRKRLK